MVSNELPHQDKLPLSKDVASLLNIARNQLRIALDIIDRSGEDIVGAHIQTAIDAIEIPMLRLQHDND